ncbi:MAG: hypothetical protein JOZ19_12730 [Rubrobacter sp.]|nr:hypothetical protein [Rubrobacter sp.]
MPGLNWNYLMTDEVLGSGSLGLMVLLIIGVSVWLLCPIVESTVKTRRKIRRSNYDALLRENKCLKDSLAEAREENDYLRKIYRNLPRRTEHRGQNAA